jgi:hypothetical protein
MKYALLIYGGLRSYEYTSKSLFDNLLNINDNIDIFISTHKENVLSSHDNIKQDFKNVYGEHLKSISFIEEKDNSYLFKKLKEKIKIIDIDLYNNYSNEIENINNFEDWNIFYKKIIANNIYGNCYLRNKNNFIYVLHEVIMIYHRLNAFNELDNYMMRNNIYYDGVIIYRPDLFFKVPVYLDKFIFDDDIIYIRLEYMFISTYKGIKKLVENFFEIFYNIKNDNDYHQYTYISEHQHNLFLYKNYKYVYDILNPLIHYRILNYINDQGIVQPNVILLTDTLVLNFDNISENTDIFYNNLKTITDKHNNS